jgi:hypothetical protein
MRRTSSKGAKRQRRWLADADDIDVTILLLMHARVPPGHSSCRGRSGTFCHECQARSFDRDADIYGIRALNSCRARTEHVFYFALAASVGA